ncbi:MAG: electron transfer flavoprotein subunit beta/FixA family protein [Candidatus Tectomicrobia bacterium]|uniref:Electron transfer flavoprotein subunit beta/FixA family protein n=1 Tax=Tectimicrobiota bacterium TaxID=2528274 RepID=A0A938B203_UNCTE|nr:electron transfer flavoprotein subunit beta/FixA family protein [Candidatus Tectomicrobia bacterium]
MALHIVVAVKQVIDPEMPLSAFTIEAEGPRVVTPATFQPVLNGFDEHALEAALRLKDSQGATITVVSVGGQFTLDIMKKALAMGADNLILCQDPLFANLSDGFVTAQVLAAAMRKIGAYDLLFCGRQASDWDNAQVPLMLAELLDVPCLALAQKIEAADGKVRVEQLIPDGYAVAEAALPALVTVSNELGAPRYPTMRTIMAANRKRPTLWKASDLALEPDVLTPRIELVELAFPSRTQQCEVITGADEAEAGRNLALKLREAKLI